MRCFNCGYQHNASDAEQCRVCGTKFPILCDVCQTPNPKLARFCMNCGSDLENIKHSLREDKLVENLTVMANWAKRRMKMCLICLTYLNVEGFYSGFWILFSYKQSTAYSRGSCSPCLDSSIKIYLHHFLDRQAILSPSRLYTLSLNRMLRRTSLLLASNSPPQPGCIIPTGILMRWLS